MFDNTSYADKYSQLNTYPNKNLTLGAHLVAKFTVAYIMLRVETQCSVYEGMQIDQKHTQIDHSMRFMRISVLIDALPPGRAVFEFPHFSVWAHRINVVGYSPPQQATPV